MGAGGGGVEVRFERSRSTFLGRGGRVKASFCFLRSKYFSGGGGGQSHMVVLKNVYLPPTILEADDWRASQDYFPLGECPLHKCWKVGKQNLI